jgi:hypothetical protein
MQNENASAEMSGLHTESTGSLADLIVEEIAAAAGQAERERDLLLGKQLAEHALRLMQLESDIRKRLSELRDGERGERGEKGEQGEQGEAGQIGAGGAKGDQGVQGDPGEKGEAITGPAGRDGIDGKDGAPGDRGECGAPGADGRTLFNIRETYDAAAKYLMGDVVTVNRSWFVARKDDPGPCPGADWKAGPSNGRDGPKGQRGDRGEPGEPGAVVVSWTIDRKQFAAVPVLSDGSKGAPLNLRALFEQFQAEVG